MDYGICPWEFGMPPQEDLNKIAKQFLDGLTNPEVDKEVESGSVVQSIDYFNLNTSQILSSYMATEQNRINPQGEPRKGKRPFQCSGCSMTFTRSTLARHKKYCARDKPVSCRWCTKSFTHARYLKIHKKSCTRKTLFECPRCTCMTSIRSRLLAHKKSCTDVGYNFILTKMERNGSSEAGVSGSSSNQKDN